MLLGRAFQQRQTASSPATFLPGSVIGVFPNFIRNLSAQRYAMLDGASIVNRDP
jgi:hypothetical protein